MMAIGAAVNQMQEAQSLFGPVMLLLMVPYMLSPIIGRAPNSTFSMVVSFMPPINTFAMMSRLASDAPPPAWQVWLTVLVGLARGDGDGLVRREGVPHRPADARQAAELRDADQVGARRLIAADPTVWREPGAPGRGRPGTVAAA